MHAIIKGAALSYLFTAAIVSAQSSTIRNQIYPGARPMGMCEAFLACADDGNTIFWNPAGLPLIDRYELQAMQCNLFNTGVNHS